MTRSLPLRERRLGRLHGEGPRAEEHLLTIGAEALSAQAKELEMAGKRGDADFIHAHHAALLRNHEELCARIAEDSEG